MDKVKEYVLESYDELVNKVEWPTWSALQESTMIVLISTIVLGLMLFIMDKISNGLLETLYSSIKGLF